MKNNNIFASSTCFSWKCATCLIYPLDSSTICPTGNGELFQKTVGERSFELCRQKQRKEIDVGPREEQEKTVKRGNSRRNINGRRDFKLKRAIVLFPHPGVLFLPPVSLLFPAPRRSVSLASLCQLCCSRRDFRNYEAIYIQMPVSNGHSRELFSTSVTSYRSASLFRLFSLISPSSFPTFASFRLQKLRQLSRYHI